MLYWGKATTYALTKAAAISTPELHRSEGVARERTTPTRYEGAGIQLRAVSTAGSEHLQVPAPPVGREQEELPACRRHGASILLTVTFSDVPMHRKRVTPFHF